MKKLKTYKLYEYYSYFTKENLSKRDEYLLNVIFLLRIIERKYNAIMQTLLLKPELYDFIYNKKYPFHVKFDELNINYWVNVSIENTNLNDLLLKHNLDKPSIFYITDNVRDFLRNVRDFCNDNISLSDLWAEDSNYLGYEDLNTILSSDFPYDESYDEIDFNGWKERTTDLINCVHLDMLSYFNEDLLSEEYIILDKHLSDMMLIHMNDYSFQNRVIEKFMDNKKFIYWFFSKVKVNSEILKENPLLDKLDVYYTSKNVGLL